MCITVHILDISKPIFGALEGYAMSDGCSLSKLSLLSILSFIRHCLLDYKNKLSDGNTIIVGW